VYKHVEYLLLLFVIPTITVWVLFIKYYRYIDLQQS